MTKIFSSKKAQITVFIIIGIILLFSSALILYIKNRINNTSPAPTIIQQVPEDLDGLQKFIESCLYETSKQALELAGKQGGHIYPKVYGVEANPDEPTEGSGLEVFPNTGYVVPYWHYLRSPNNCRGICAFSSKMPSLRNAPGSIEEQVSRYVDENIKYCVQNFNIYTSRGFDINVLEPIKTRTTVTLNDVVVDAYWPIEAGVDKISKIERFLVHLPVNLRSMYNFASDFIELQSNLSYLETNTMNLITYDSAAGKGELPPTADYSFLEGENKAWSFEKSKKRINSILSIWVSALTVKNTLNYERHFYPEGMVQAAMDKMIIETFSEEYYPYSVRFRYSRFWPIYLDITPRNGDELKGKGFSGFGVLPLLGISINQYEFQYDVSYPVLVEIYNPSAFNEEGYGLVFALEANVRNNKPLTGDFNPVDVSAGPVATFACDEKQKKSGNITVKVLDAFTKKPIKDASVMYSFGKQGCSMGTTKIINESAYLTERYPKGIGKLTVSKRPDYISFSQIYAVGDGQEDELDVSLYPIIEKDVSVKKYNVKKDCSNGIWSFDNKLRNISFDETVNVIIRKTKTTDDPDDLVGGFLLNGSLEENHTVKLGPGKYEVTIITVRHQNLTIPERTKEYGDDDETEQVTFKEMHLAPHMEGNIKYTFEVRPELLYNSSVIEFHALAFDLLSVPENCRDQTTDVSPSPSADSIYSAKRALLEPKFIGVSG